MLDPIPETKLPETAPFWNSYMKAYDYLNKVDSYTRSMNDIVGAARPIPADSILDAGSGTGNLSILLSKHGADVTSLDFSSAALEEHRKKSPGAKQICASLEARLPLSDSTFDTVCCASVLFALSKSGSQLAVSEFYRVLKPGGTVIITIAAPAMKNSKILSTHFQQIYRAGGVPAVLRGVGSLPSIARILYYNSKLRRFSDWNGYHRFSEQELRALVEGAHFQSIDVKCTYGGKFFLLTARRPAI